MGMSRLLPWLLLAIGAVAAFGYVRSISPTESTPTTPPKIDFIIGGPDPFWEEVTDGARDAAERYDVELRVHEPDGTEGDQTRVLLSIDPNKSDGVAISPLAPKEQAKQLSVLASKVRLITYDNDASDSTRLCYVGTNNWSAGQHCAELVRQALSDGGKIAIFVGDNERENARKRRQGFVGGLANEQPNLDPSVDDLDQPLEVGNYRIVATYLDHSDPEKAEANAAEAIEDHPDLDAMVGFYGYNGPACLAALEKADKLGKIKLIAFDEHQETLDGIAAGHIFGTVAQAPYRYGFEAVRILADLYRSPISSTPFPGSGTMYIPCSKVTKENLEAFTATEK